MASILGPTWSLDDASVIIVIFVLYLLLCILGRFFVCMIIKKFFFEFSTRLLHAKLNN